MKELDNEKYRIYLRGLQKAIEIYRDENIPLMVEMETKQQEYGAIAAKMTVEIDGQKMTMQKAAQFLKDTIAKNAGFKNYRDYKFAAMGRFDYTPADCYAFHDSIAKEIVPIIEGFDKIRMNKMGLENYKPWDTSVDASGKAPLKPFEGGEDLINKSIRCFERLRPFYGECLCTMKAMKHLDL